MKYVFISVNNKTFNKVDRTGEKITIVYNNINLMLLEL